MTGQERMRGIWSRGCGVEMRGRLAMYVWGPGGIERGDLRDVEVGTGGVPGGRDRGSLGGRWGPPRGRGASPEALPWLACPSPRSGAP